MKPASTCNPCKCDVYRVRLSSKLTYALTSSVIIHARDYHTVYIRHQKRRAGSRFAVDSNSALCTNSSHHDDLGEQEACAFRKRYKLHQHVCCRWRSYRVSQLVCARRKGKPRVQSVWRASIAFRYYSKLPVGPILRGKSQINVIDVISSNTHPYLHIVCC